jgi:iron complex outermembrane receptor protein
MNNPVRAKSVIQTILLTTACFVPAAASAQRLPDSSTPAPQEGTTTGLQDIVVTAQRRSESAQKTPLAITAIGGENLKAAGITDTADLRAAVPNVQIFSPFGRTQPNISMRGVSIANEFNANQTSPIGVYVDDAYMASRVSHGMQLYDLERVEVLRGPQGTLFGRNTTGGAINFITKRPDLNENGGELSVGYGNFDRKSASSAANFVLAQDKLALRVAGDYVHSDPMVKNKLGLGDFQAEDAKGIRVSLLAKPNDDFTVFLKYYYGYGNSLQVANHFLGTAADGSSPFTGYKRSADLGFYEVESRAPGRYRATTQGFLGTLSYELGDFTLNTLTSYDWGHRRFSHNADNTPQAILDQRFNDFFKQFNQEVRLNYQGDGISAIVGGYYGRDKFRENAQEKDFLFFLKGIVPFDFPNSGFGIRQRSYQTRSSIAGFGQIDWEIIDNLKVTVGARYTSDKIRFRSNANILDYDYNPVFNTVPDFGPYDPSLFLERADTGSALTGRLGLSYQATPDMLLFSSFSKGYRAGAVNGGGYLSPTQVTVVRPEKVEAWEAGIKSDWFDRRLRANITAFRYSYKNQQLVEVVAAAPLLRNAPKAKIQGIEAELQAIPLTDLTLNVNIGLLNAEYQGLILSGQNLDGNKLPFAPKFTSNVSANWKFAEVGDFSLTAIANWTYASRQWFSPFNDVQSSPTDATTNVRLQQKAFSLVNGTITIASDKYSISLWGKNLFNTHYYTYGIDLREAFGYDYLALGTPRTYGISAGFKF